MSGRMGANSIEKMSHSKSGQVISWCPSCCVQFTRDDDPGYRAAGRRAAVRDDAVPAVSARAAGSADPAVARGRSRCGSRCTGIPAWPASWKPPRKSCGRSLASSSSICSNRRVGLQSNNLRVLPALSASCNGMSPGGVRCRRRRAGRRLSFRSSRTVRARARLAVPHRQRARSRRREHGPAPPRPLQGAQADAVMPTRSSPNARI